jgi:hypothetical protein
MATVQGFKGIAKELLSQLKDRFDYVYDDKHMRFDGIHLISTALDPNLLVFLNDEMKRAIERNLIRCTQWVLGVSQLFLNIRTIFGRTQKIFISFIDGNLNLLTQPPRQQARTGPTLAR